MHAVLAISVPILIQVGTSFLVFLKFKEAALNVLCSWLLTSVLYLAFLLAFNGGAFDVIAAAIISMLSLLFGSPLMFAFFCFLRKLL